MAVVGNPIGNVERNVAADPSTGRQPADSGGTNPLWQYTSLLLHFDEGGTGGATTETVDSGPFEHTVTVGARSRIEDAAAKFGQSGIDCDYLGTGALAGVTIPNHASLAFGTEPWTWEGWMNPTITTSNRTVIEQRDAGANAWALTLYISTANNLIVYANGTAQVQTGASGVSAGWQHFAVTYDGTFLRLFLRGTFIGKANVGAQTWVADSITYVGDGPAGDFLGHMDEVRALKGIALYDSDDDFAPPEAAFPGETL